MYKNTKLDILHSEISMFSYIFIVEVTLKTGNIFPSTSCVFLESFFGFVIVKRVICMTVPRDSCRRRHHHPHFLFQLHHHHQNPTIRGPRWIIDSDKVSHCADMFQALQRHCVGCLPPGSPFSRLGFPVLFPSQRPHLLPSSGLAREFHTNSNYTARWQRGKTEALVYVNMLHLLGSAPKTILWIWLIKPCISQQMQASW